MIVDYQSHWYPPAVVEWFEDRVEPPRARRGSDGWQIQFAEDVVMPAPAIFTDLTAQLMAMDAAGVDVAVVGPAVLGELAHLPAAEAVEIANLVNREYASARALYPERLVPLAVVPVTIPEAALEVIDHASRLGFSGVSIVASNDGVPIASEATLPVYRRLDELGMPVFLHPGLRSHTRRYESRRGEQGMAWMYQTARAATTLVDSGTLDECPNLTIVHPHLGGVLPYILERVDARERSAKRPMREYLSTRFYTDCVAQTPGALPLAIATYGLDRVLFGSDFPYQTTADARQYLAASAEPSQADAIYRNRLPGLRLPGGATQPTT